MSCALERLSAKGSVLVLLCLMCACSGAQTPRDAASAPLTARSGAPRALSLARGQSAVPTLALAHPLARHVLALVQRLETPTAQAQGYEALAQGLLKQRDFAAARQVLRYGRWALKADPEASQALARALGELEDARAMQRFGDLWWCGGGPRCAAALAPLSGAWTGGDPAHVLAELSTHTLFVHWAARLDVLERAYLRAADASQRRALLEQWSAELETQQDPERYHRAKLRQLKLAMSSDEDEITKALRALAARGLKIPNIVRREEAAQALIALAITHPAGAAAIHETPLIRSMRASIADNRASLSQLKLALGRWDEALALTVDHSPREHLVEVCRGLALKAQLDKLSTCVEALEGTPDYGPWVLKLVRAHLDASQKDAANALVTRYERYMHAQEILDDVDALNALASMMVATGAAKKAAPLWSRALMLLKREQLGYESLWSWLKLIDSQLGVDEALAQQSILAFTQALEQDPLAFDLYRSRRLLDTLTQLPKAPQLMATLAAYLDEASVEPYMRWLTTQLWPKLTTKAKEQLLSGLFGASSAFTLAQQQRLLERLSEACAQDSQSLALLEGAYEIISVVSAEPGAWALPMMRALLEGQIRDDHALSWAQTRAPQARDFALTALLERRPWLLEKLPLKALTQELQSGRGMGARGLRYAVLKVALDGGRCELAKLLLTDSSLGTTTGLSFERTWPCLKDPAQLEVFLPLLLASVSDVERVEIYLKLWARHPQPELWARHLKTSSP